MPRKPPKKSASTGAAVPPQRKRRKTGKQVRTSLQIIPKVALETPGHIKDLFCVVFEETCGNISATCELLKMDRKTYYNWIRDDADFAARIAEIRADERFIDVAEFSLLQKIREGDVTATIFTLKSKGKHRGWSERPDTIVIPPDILDRVAYAYNLWLTDNADASLEDKIAWLGKFADRARVPRAELAKKVGMET